MPEQERREMERFDPRATRGGCFPMEPFPDGEWVRFEDAEARIAELEREVITAREMHGAALTAQQIFEDANQRLNARAEAAEQTLASAIEEFERRAAATEELRQAALRDDDTIGALCHREAATAHRADALLLRASSPEPVDNEEGDCKTCKGGGSVTVSQFEGRRKARVDRRCPACSGTGKKPTPEETK